MSIDLPPIRRKVIADLLAARLRTLTGVAVGVGEAPDPVPLLEDSPGVLDASGRVAPYVVLFAGTGRPYVNDERDVAQTHEDLSAVHQVTCVAGYSDDCLQLADRVHLLLFGWHPALEGLGFDRMVPPAGYDPGTPRKDKDVRPVRFFVPLQYRLDVTT